MTYYFEVNQRNSFMLGSLFGVLGQVIESGGSQCGGNWEIKEVSSEYALPRLEHLKNTLD